MQKVVRANRQTERDVLRQADRQTLIEAYRDTDRQTDKQEETPNNKRTEVDMPGSRSQNDLSLST